MRQVLLVRVNCTSEAEARAIAEAAVEKRLAAAANIHPPVSSVYHWKDAVTRAEEVPLELKTRPALFDRLCALIRDLHGYQSPGIIALAADRVDPAYLAWLHDETIAGG